METWRISSRMKNKPPWASGLFVALMASVITIATKNEILTKPDALLILVIMLVALLPLLIRRMRARSRAR